VSDREEGGTRLLLAWNHHRPPDRGRATLPPPEPTSPRARPWLSLGVSATLHALVLLLAIRLSRAPEPEAHQPQAVTDPSRQVQMVYLQPPPRPAPAPPEPKPQPPPPQPRPAPAPPVPRLAPPPAKAQPRPEPDANAPPEAVRREGAEPTEDAKPGGEPTAAPESKTGTPVPTASEAATMESEAKRIFGSPRPGPRPGAGPQASRPMEAYLPDHPEQCIPKPSVPADSSAGPQYGMVTGKIYRQNDGRPLAGAHLQMIGTPYVTFTDGAGEYHFRFDLSLVDNCRTQYVRVTAPGYETRLLVLLVGENVQSDDVRLKRK
jgi:hypothetical protein